MKLIDLDPNWLMRDGKRIGFTFISPINPKWRQICFAVSVPRREQWEIFGEDNVQGCNPSCCWVIDGGIDAADFNTISVTPSLDGSAGGLWHGFITGGEIVGGLPN